MKNYADASQELNRLQGITNRLEIETKRKTETVDDTKAFQHIGTKIHELRLLLEVEVSKHLKYTQDRRGTVVPNGNVALSEPEKA